MTNVNPVSQVPVGYHTYGPPSGEATLGTLGIVVSLLVLAGVYAYFWRQAKRQQAKADHPSSGRGL